MPGTLRTTTAETLSLPPAASAASIKPVHRHLRIGFRQQGCDRAVLDHAGEPVAAQQELIAGLEPAVDDVELKVRIGTDRPRDAIGERMIARLLRCQLAMLDQLLDVGMIAGELLQLAVPQPIDPAVAGPDHREIVLEHQQGDDGAAVHLAALRRARSAPDCSAPGSRRPPATARARWRAAARDRARPRSGRSHSRRTRGPPCRPPPPRCRDRAGPGRHPRSARGQGPRGCAPRTATRFCVIKLPSSRGVSMRHPAARKSAGAWGAARRGATSAGRAPSPGSRAAREVVPDARSVHASGPRRPRQGAGPRHPLGAVPGSGQSKPSIPAISPSSEPPSSSTPSASACASSNQARARTDLGRGRRVGQGAGHREREVAADAVDAGDQHPGHRPIARQPRSKGKAPHRAGQIDVEPGVAQGLLGAGDPGLEPISPRAW